MTHARPARIAAAMDARDFESAGLYDPEAADADQVLELLQWLEAQGVTLESMCEHGSVDRLVFAANAGRPDAAPLLTQRELSARIGVGIDTLDRFRIAFGIPPGPPDAPWCSEKEAEGFAIVSAATKLFGEEATLRFARVVGTSVARVAEAMITMSLERIRALRNDGARLRVLAEANLDATRSASGPTALITALLPLHLLLARSRIRDRRMLLIEETVRGCVVFVDLVGSTTLSRRLSIRDLAAMVDHFEAVANDIATSFGGRVVKFIGDEVMVVTSQPGAACAIALELIERFRADTSVTPRGGIASGALLDRSGDYYGPVVNLAARLAELAVPSELLVSVEVAADLDPSVFRSEPAGRRALRGFDEPVPVASVARV